eukprot:1070287-Prorocentrum_minimum.AAC.1
MSGFEAGRATRLLRRLLTGSSVHIPEIMYNNMISSDEKDARIRVTRRCGDPPGQTPSSPPPHPLLTPSSPHLCPSCTVQHTLKMPLVFFILSRVLRLTGV